MQDKKLVPRLRFPEFFDEWIKSTVGKVANFTNGKGHEQFIDEKGKYIVVNSKFVSTNGETKKFSDKQLVPLIVDYVAIVMSDIPNGKALGKCYLIDKDDTYTLNQRIGGLKPKVIIGSLLYRLMNRNKYFLSFDNGVSQTNLRKDEVLSCPIVYPSAPEQQKISAFLTKVDSWISNLKSQKIELEKYKSGLMQKIFSLEKIARYKVAKLSDMTVNPVSDGPHLTPKFLTTGVPFLSVDNLVGGKIRKDNLRYISSDDHVEFSRKCKPENGDILLGKAASIGAVAIANFESDFNVWSPVAVIRISDSNSNIYVYFQFQSDLIKRQIKKLVNSSSQGNLGMGDIKTLKFVLPSLPEQQKIADLLTIVDNVIESKQHQISQAENWKRGLLQKMFV